MLALERRAAEVAALTALQRGDDLPDLASLLNRPAWQRDAACAEPEHDLSLFFPANGGSVAAAKRVCAGCLVRAECAAYADEVDDEGPLDGVWGGRSAVDRRKARKSASTSPPRLRRPTAAVDELVALAETSGLWGNALLERWNTTHPEWAYSGWAAMFATIDYARRRKPEKPLRRWRRRGDADDVELADFVDANRDASPVERMRRWNDANPDRRFASITHFASACQRAARPRCLDCRAPVEQSGSRCSTCSLWRRHRKETARDARVLAELGLDEEVRRLDAALATLEALPA